MTVLSAIDWRYRENGKTIGGRFVVGNDPAAHSRESATAKISRPQACQRPGSSYRNPFCVEDRNRLGGFAPGTGLGQRHDLLAASARLAKAGVWEKLHKELLRRLHAADRIDWSRAVVDSSSVRAVFGGSKQVVTRQIAAKRAVSIIFAPMPKAFR
jgi:hypothetical protein